MRWFLLCFGLRVLNALAVRQTFFVPDEYWQALEVAHHAVFGWGDITWEWQWSLRSWAHPSLYAALYAGLKYTGMDGRHEVVTYFCDRSFMMMSS